MDPKVRGKLLTTHRRGYGVDVEALRDGFPLRQNAGDGSRMGSHGYKRLQWRKYFFDDSLYVLGVCRLIWEEEVRRWPPEGPRRQGARPEGVGAPSYLVAALAAS